MKFEILDRDGPSRAGRLTTKNGAFDTPAFMPVGTAGTVKALTPQQLQEAGAQVILANTYHLFLRPGTGVIGKFGSLHRFMGWDKPILTDSGGFQIFSLRGNARVGEEGVRFKSHLDGSSFALGPEDVVDIQNALDSDIQMALDHFAPHPATRSQDEKALRLTSAWAARARARFSRTNRANSQFAIVQGGLHEDLRQRSLHELAAMDFEGYAVGGLSVGETPAEFQAVLRALAPELPGGKPRYLMGSGTPEDILFRRGERHGHVRLRPAVAQCPQRHAFRLARQGADQEREVQVGSPSPGRGLRLLHLPEFFTRLPAAPVHLPRDPLLHPEHHPQYPFLP